MKKIKKINERLVGCPVEALLRIIGQRWNAYILHVLLTNGIMRFGALKREIPNISQKVLTEKLRELESYGLISRKVVPVIPPEVSYKLTPRGLELKSILKQISDTAHIWRAERYI